MPPSIQRNPTLITLSAPPRPVLKPHPIASRRAKLQFRLARTVAAFCAVSGPSHLAYASMRDYARSRAGISPTQFLRLRRIGAFLHHCPDANRLSSSVIDHLARRIHPREAAALVDDLQGLKLREARRRIDDLAWRAETLSKAGSVDPPPAESGVRSGAESERWCTPAQKIDAALDCALDPTVDPNYETVSLFVPSQVATYLYETLDLASALLGHEVPECESIDAVVAEASTEITPHCTAAEARRQLGIGRDQRPDRSQHHRPTPKTTTFEDLPWRFRRGNAPAARALDRILLRLLKLELHLDLALEDALLDDHLEGAHHCAGLPRFIDYAHARYGLERNTVFDYLNRAQARRRHHPVSLARAEGTPSAVQAQLLEQFVHQCHVPDSATAAWVEYASNSSVRRLKQSFRWARSKSMADYRAWSLAECPPPTEAQVRTSVHRVHEIAAEPDPEILAHTNEQPTTQIRWTLRRETLDALVQMMAAMPAQAVAQNPDPDPLAQIPTPPSWWSLLAVFVIARAEWAVVERQRRTYRQAVLERDNYQCVVSHCTQRRGLEVHHLRYRSAGGGDTPENLATLCVFHHHALHDGRLTVLHPKDLIYSA